MKHVMNTDELKAVCTRACVGDPRKSPSFGLWQELLSSTALCCLFGKTAQVSLESFFLDWWKSEYFSFSVRLAFHLNSLRTL